MQKFLFFLSEIAGLVALMACILDRRGPGRMPLLDFLRDRFTVPHRLASRIVLVLIAGSLVVIVPWSIYVASGRSHFVLNGEFTVSFLVLSLLSVVIKTVMAAFEEIIFRGAVLTQVAKRAPVWTAVLISAGLFAVAHLERTGASRPSWMSMTVFFLDGVCFAIAYLATGTLWVPTLWHTTKNLWIWILGGGSFQFVHGLLQTDDHAQAGLTDVITTAAITFLALLFCKDHFKANRRWAKMQ